MLTDTPEGLRLQEACLTRTLSCAPSYTLLSRAYMVYSGPVHQVVLAIILDTVQWPRAMHRTSITEIDATRILPLVFFRTSAVLPGRDVDRENEV